MSRNRPRTSKSSPYITATGFAALGAELQDLWTRRGQVVSHLSAAAAEGDRSENAEYIYRKKQLRELDRRIGYLQRRVPVLIVVERSPEDSPSVVYFGATVRLADEQDKLVAYRIVGADEADARRNWISIDSPVARALLKCKTNDEVRVHTPSGMRFYRITDITYE